MSSNVAFDFQAFTAALRAQPRRWVIPAAVLGGLALLYAIFLHSPAWEARQSFLVRDEAASSLTRDVRPGRFDGADSMKAAQETVMELARSRSVVAAALTEVGPPRDGDFPQSWPTQAEVEQLQDAITIKAPNGAEFGKTEVFYLLVRHTDRQRALALAEALTNQLERYLQEVRERKADSLVAELTRAADLARADLEAATNRLTELEQAAGNNFAELRLLTDSVGGESHLRSALTSVKDDQRQARLQQASRRQLLDFLKNARLDPSYVLETPSDLLALQPALEQLKRGLTEAELTTARLQGTMTNEHPLVQAALIAETEIRERLQHQIAAAIVSLETELGLGEGRLATLDGQLAETTEGISRVASLRAHYANAASEVRHHDELFKHAQQDLAAARAGQAAANITSLLTRLEEPYTPNSPSGPSRAMIVLAGILGGLAIGMGLVFHQLPATGKVQPPQAEAARPVHESSAVNANPQFIPRQAERRRQPSRRIADRRQGQAPSWWPSANGGVSLPAILGFGGETRRDPSDRGLSLKEALERLK
jgi:uncharacterized protein involved in exopolysaccharide biosynthesis